VSLLSALFQKYGNVLKKRHGEKWTLMNAGKRSGKTPVSAAEGPALREPFIPEPGVKRADETRAPLAEAQSCGKIVE
jgi:hypothetical protein